MAVTINTRSVSNTSWGSVDKTSLRNRLVSALEDGEEGTAAAVREVYAVIRETSLTESPSSSWWGPHHVLTGDSVILNRDGLFAAAGALAGARAEADLSSQQKQKAARHLIRHYRRIQAEIPEALTEIATGRQDSNEQAIRYDVGRFGKTRKTPQGFLQTTGRLTRTGIFTYRLPDGSARKELRLDEEVFNPVSMESFNHIPITNDHPFPRRLITSKNAVEHQKGYTLGDTHQDGSHLVASLIVTDEGTIKDIENGKQELSNGYTCNLDFSSGSFKGQKYDAIQRNIVGNHVAIISKGTARAGSSARLTLDSVDDPASDLFLANIAVMDSMNSDDDIDSNIDKDEPDNNPINKDRKKMATIKIDNVTYTEVPEGVAGPVQSALQKRDDQIETLNTEAKTRTDELSEVQGKLTAAETALEKAKEDKVDEDAIEKKVIALAKERTDLLSVASKLLKEDELEKLGDAKPIDIMKAVILSENSDAKFDEVDDSFIKGQFAMTVKYATDRTEKADKQTKTADKAQKTDTTDEDVPDSDKVLKATMIKIHNDSRGIKTKED